MSPSKKRQAYALAIGVAVAVVVVRYGLLQALGERALLLPFVLAVVIAAWRGGLGPGLVATGLCVLLRVFFVEPSPLAWSEDSLVQGVNLLIFTLIGVTISVLCEALHVARRREIEQQLRVLEITADEDRRIGMELHDNTQQQLAGLGLLAQGLAESLAEKSASEAALAARVARGLNDVAHDVHLLSRGLVPVDVDAEGLRSALGELARTIGEQYPVSCEFRCTGSVDVADNFVATHMYRMAQEAVNNAIKHGSPGRIELSLSGSDKNVTLAVLDDGVGIDETRAGGPGMGMRVMRYRAELIGGMVQIARRNGRGTKVTCTVPRNRLACDE